MVSRTGGLWILAQEIGHVLVDEVLECPGGKKRRKIRRGFKARGSLSGGPMTNFGTCWGLIGASMRGNTHIHSRVPIRTGG